MHEVHWDFEIQIDHQILAKWPDLEIKKGEEKKENLPYTGLCHPSLPRCRN